MKIEKKIPSSLSCKYLKFIDKGHCQQWRWSGSCAKPSLEKEAALISSQHWRFRLGGSELHAWTLKRIRNRPPGFTVSVSYPNYWDSNIAHLGERRFSRTTQQRMDRPPYRGANLRAWDWDYAEKLGQGSVRVCVGNQCEPSLNELAIVGRLHAYYVKTQAFTIGICNGFDENR